MNKREDALREALQKNEEECQRWQAYLKENETAMENMRIFGKKLTVDVMVPVGKKAFMPGHLLHTNEVLVGHYQGYFSKCTTFKAMEICEFRVKMAKEHIKSLETEADFWQNKLVKPYEEGVMPRGEEREIIEELDEKTEKSWKERHRISVRQAKQKEREERFDLQKPNSKEKTDEEIFQLLEEAELMEELEQELSKLELNEVNDESIRKLMSGEIELKEKKRLAHVTSLTQNKNGDKPSLLPNIVKKNEISAVEKISTNNNVQPNPLILNLFNPHDENVEDIENENLPDEVTLIKEQAKFLSVEDQIGFYDYQIQIIRQKLLLLPLRTPRELNEKIHLLNVLDHLEELFEESVETVGAAELTEREIEEETEKNETFERRPIKNSDIYSEKECIEYQNSECEIERKSNQKRRISFALEDQTLEFKKHEAVTQMLPGKMEKKQHAIIKLDNKNDKPEEICKLKMEKSLNKKNSLIQATVEKNLQYVAENQSKQDYDLVQQILQLSTGQINTLHINFKHSEQEGYSTDSKISTNVPGNPADIFNLYTMKKQYEKDTEPSILFINSYEGEDQVKAPLLKEVDRETAFFDPKSEFSNPFQSKSILRNKSDVDKENHLQYSHQESSNGNEKPKRTVKNDEDDCLSAYYKVMNDVVEKPLTEPEPLPGINFIDAHTPKKRVSRFKQMRQGKGKT